jgi:16S rRNA processing protein RimM
MAYNNKILFGRIVKINGYDGTVTVKSEQEFTEDIPHMESVFIETEGKPVPFFISGMEMTGTDTIKLRFSGYESSDKISEFNGCRIFLTVASGPGPAEAEKDLTGYYVFLRNKKLLGTITKVIRYPGQSLLSVQSPEKKEILIPLHSDFVVAVDEKTLSILMDLPEGLTDLNKTL